MGAGVVASRMPELTFHGLDVGKVEPGDDLVDRIIETTSEEYPLQDGDVVVITSKVVSMAEERLIDADDVTVTERDERVGEVTGLDPREVAVIYEESEVLGGIPIADIGEDLILEHATDREAARAALLFGQADERTPVTVVRGLDYDDGEGVPNSGGLIRRGLRKTVQLTARLKAREWF
jgi:F420-0:gamma-glutamyl ligase